MDAHTRQTARP